MRKKLIAIVFLLVAIGAVPQVTFASWWNPFSWSWAQSIFSNPSPKNEAVDTGRPNTPEAEQEAGVVRLATTTEENPSEQPCPNVSSPMCATSGVTYRNYCELQRAGAVYNYGGNCVLPNNSTPTPPAGTSNTDNDTRATSSTCLRAAGVDLPQTPLPANCPTTTPTTTTPPPTNSTATSPTNEDTGNTPPAPTQTPATQTTACGVRAATSQRVNLIIRDGSYYYRPTPAKAGQSIVFWASIKNVGADDMGRWRSENVAIGPECFSTAYFKVDTNNDGQWDVTKKADMGPLRKDRESLKSSGGWTAVAGNHKYQICADGANTIDETDESDNCVNGTIEVSR